MACGARSGLKLVLNHRQFLSSYWLNGLWSPFGIETMEFCLRVNDDWDWLNGLWSPFGIETYHRRWHIAYRLWAKWRGRAAHRDRARHASVHLLANWDP